MVDHETLARRLRALEDYENKLANFASFSEEEFLREDPLHDLAERYLHLAVECMIDMGNHILSESSCASPDSYREVFAELAKQGLIAPDLAARLQGWASFRNVLAHLYLDIDHRISWRAIRSELGDLAEFREAVIALL